MSLFSNHTALFKKNSILLKKKKKERERKPKHNSMWSEISESGSVFLEFTDK